MQCRRDCGTQSRENPSEKLRNEIADGSENRGDCGAAGNGSVAGYKRAFLQVGAAVDFFSSDAGERRADSFSGAAVVAGCVGSDGWGGCIRVDRFWCLV